MSLEELNADVLTTIHTVVIRFKMQLLVKVEAVVVEYRVGVVMTVSSIFVLIVLRLKN